jgi:hypothetical protein
VTFFAPSSANRASRCAHLLVQLAQRMERGSGHVVVDAAVVAGQPWLVGVEVAVVGEHEHPQPRLGTVRRQVLIGSGVLRSTPEPTR